jgi:SNF2 family DNA or RNA helicase
VARSRARTQNRKRLKFWQHQRKTLELYKRSPIVFDTSDPGTGKTLSALAAWEERRAKGGGKALVLAPKTLLESAWDEELRKFFPHVKSSVAYAANREKAFKANADIYITNLDAVKWLVKQPKAFYKDFDTIMIDESTAFKHRTSQRSKAVDKIVKHFHYRVCMTGTPNSNSITDVHNQIYLLDNGERLGASFYGFRNAVCIPEQVGPRPEHVKWVDRPEAEGIVAENISDITVRHRFDQCMDIPPNFQHTVPFTLSPRNRKIYDQLESDTFVQLSDGEVSAIHAAALRTKLLQIASGAVYTSEGSWSVIDKTRYELVLDLVCAREHSLVFFNWKHQKEELASLADKLGVKHEIIDGTVSDKHRKEIVADYQEGKFQTLFLHPRTGAHGLTLTRGTATIWASPIYEPDFLKQGIHRVYRGGQKKKTETLLVCARNTVEQKVYEILGTKNSRMVTLLSLLQKRSQS